MRTRLLSLFVSVALVAGCTDGSGDDDDDDNVQYDAHVSTPDAEVTPPPDAAPLPPDAAPAPDAEPVECNDPSDCDDGVGCTDNECIGHVCMYTARNANCNDGLYCNGVETCDAELDCQPGTPPTADDGVDCTDMFCNEDTDTVEQIANDDNCNDGLFCNGVETCDPALDCQPGTAPAIDDGIECTNDSCDEVNDVVVHAPNHGFCADGVFCNGDELCVAGAGCQPPSPRNLSDGVDCTDDTCDEEADVVVHTPNDANCDDELWCNGAETCDATLDCQDGEPPILDDEVPCTDDTCDEEADAVVNMPNDANCDDGLFCNGEETCDAVADCQVGTPPMEDDNIDCTSDLCDEATDTFDHIPSDFACVDGNLCTRDVCDETSGCGHPDDPMCEVGCGAPVYDNGRYDEAGGFDADAGSLSIVEAFSLPSLGGTEMCTIKFTMLRDMELSGYQQVRIRIYDTGTGGLAGLGDFDSAETIFDQVFTSGDNLEIYDTGDDVGDLDVVDYVARVDMLPVYKTLSQYIPLYPDLGEGNRGIHLQFLDPTGEGLWATAPETGGTECGHAWGPNQPTPVDLCVSEGSTLPEQLAFTILGPMDCGNGQLNRGEECDDGDFDDGDGCNNACQVEPYWRCQNYEEGPSDCWRIRILYAPAGASASGFQSAVAAITGGPVTYINANDWNPELDDIEDYDCVYTHPIPEGYDYPYDFGDLLGYFVAELRGNVVLGIGCAMPPIGIEQPLATEVVFPGGLAGYIMDLSPAYNPYEWIFEGPVTYAGDGATFLHNGVSAYSCGGFEFLELSDQGDRYDGSYVLPDEGDFPEGADFAFTHAYSWDWKVVYSNGLPVLGAGDGDWPRLIANSCAAGFQHLPPPFVDIEIIATTKTTLGWMARRQAKPFTVPGELAK